MHIYNVLCVAKYKYLRRADPSYRGFLQTVVCVTKSNYENLNLRRPWPTRAAEK